MRSVSTTEEQASPPARGGKLTLRAAVTRRWNEKNEGLPPADKRSLLGFASGLVAGVVGVVTGFPFDTLKVRMQVYGSTQAVAVGPGSVELGPWARIRGLFRGVGPPLVTTGIVQTINFGVYDNVLRYLRGNAGEEGLVPSLSHYFVAGASGGFAISFITCPASLVKIQLQVSLGDRGYINIMRDMMKRGLIQGFYRAYVPDVLNQMIGRGTYMMTYEALKRALREPGQEDLAHLGKPQPLWQRIIAGGLAGITGWLSIYPLDVCKSRMQADALSKGPNRYKGTLDCIVQSYRSGGLGSLFQGLNVTLLRAVPVASVILPAYDASYWYLARYFDEEGFPRREGPPIVDYE